MRRIFVSAAVLLIVMAFPSLASACPASLASFNKTNISLDREPARVWQEVYASDLENLLALGGKLAPGKEREANSRLQKSLLSLVEARKNEYKNLQSQYQKETEACLVSAAETKKKATLAAADKKHKEASEKLVKEREEAKKNFEFQLAKAKESSSEELGKMKASYLKKKAYIQKVMNKTSSYQKAIAGAKKLKKNKKLYKKSKARMLSGLEQETVKIEKGYRELEKKLAEKQKVYDKSLAESNKSAEATLKSEIAKAKSTASSSAKLKYQAQITTDPKRDAASIRAKAQKINNLITRLYKRDKVESLYYSYPKNKPSISWPSISSQPTWGKIASPVSISRPKVTLAGPDFDGNGAILSVGDGFSLQTKERLGVDRLKSVSTPKAKSSKSLADLRENFEDKYSVVVFDSGSRDAASSDIQNNLREVAKIVGPKRCIVVPTLYVPGNAARNEHIRSFAGQRLGVVVADWASVADKNEKFRKENSYFQLTERGKAKRAELVRAAIADCLNGDWAKARP